MKNDKLLIELFGQKVRLLRMSKGLSQEELGLKSGLHRTYIGQIERAKRKINIQNIDKIAYSLDVDYQELFDFRELYNYRKK